MGGERDSWLLFTSVEEAAVAAAEGNTTTPDVNVEAEDLRFFLIISLAMSVRTSTYPVS